MVTADAICASGVPVVQTRTVIPASGVPPAALVIVPQTSPPAVSTKFFPDTVSGAVATTIGVPRARMSALAHNPAHGWLSKISLMWPVSNWVCAR